MILALVVRIALPRSRPITRIEAQAASGESVTVRA
jgi:hypothetical protein